MSNADIRGRFVWHELMTTDIKAAGAFYPKVTAWKTEAWDKDPSYTLWVSAKGPFGGVRTLPDAARTAGPHWLAYIGTPDVDATVQSAQRLGARVTMGATDIPGTGRMAVLADPQGAAFALFSPAAAPPSGASMPQEFSWHELTTTDADAALSFYGELFGWTQVGTHDMGPMGIYHLVGIQGVQSIGMFKITGDRPMPTQWMCYAHVADVDKSANAAKASGGKLVHGPMEVPGGTWIAQLTDPQGAAFAVHADKRVVSATPAAQPAKAAAPKSPAAPPAAKAPPVAAKPSPPTLTPPAAAPSASPAKPKPAPAVSAPATVPATSRQPVAAKTKPKKAPAKAAVKKVAKKKVPVKKAAKKAVKKKAPKKKGVAKKRPKSKTAAKKTGRKSSAKRKSVKKPARKSSRRRSSGGFALARRFAVKQADSLLKRLRGKKRR
jgi:predicted enzyme related to lactoylglutathione lyase